MLVIRIFDANCGDDSPSAGHPAAAPSIRLQKVDRYMMMNCSHLMGQGQQSAAAVAEIRAIITLSSPIVVTENSIWLKLKCSLKELML